MYYFKYDDANILKYDVVYKKEELITLRNRVVNNCSVIVHRDVVSSEIPSGDKKAKIKKVTSKKIDQDLYHFSYEEHYYPYLVTIIDMLLKEDASVIDDIYSDRRLVDINSLVDETKRNNLARYYSILANMLSFDLIAVINTNELNECKSKKNIKKRIRTR